MFSLNQVLENEPETLKNMVFVVETQSGETYLQIKKSTVEKGVILQIQDVSDSVL